ncbi:MAG: sugar transferase [Anaerolineae bacterium]
MLFSIVLDSFLALVVPFFLLSVNWLEITLTIPVWVMMISIVLTRVITFNTLGLYSSNEQPRFITEVGIVIWAMIISVLVALGTLSLLNATFAPEWVAGMTLGSLGVHLGWRFVAYSWSYYKAIGRILAPRRVLVIGAGEIGRELADVINKFPLPTTTVVGFLDNHATGAVGKADVLGTLDDDIFQIIREHDVDEIVLTTTRYVERDNSSAIVNLQHVPVPVRVVPAYLKLNLYSSRADSLDQLPLTRLRQPAMSSATRLVKRAMDISAASIALVMVLPFFSLIAFLIWLNDRGPVFFKQERYGENGKIFQMLKFRSMVVNADQMVEDVAITDDDGKTIYKRKNDPRVTAVGQFIRKTSLDELPQLINIIRGDMSIVGPRPEVRKIVETEYEEWQYERMRVPQGLTGWWQVNGRSEKECYQDTEKDIFYVNNHSIWLDIKIILMTVPALLKGKGAF